MSDKSSIRVLIVTYNSINDISACLESIYDTQIPQIQVTIIDNNSIDNTVQYVKDTYPQIEIIETGYNGGYAYANNIGIRKYLISSFSTSAFLILNPDVLIKSTQITSLYNTLMMNHNIGAVSPWILDDFKKKNYVKNIFGNYKRNIYNSIENLLITDMLHGACMMIKAEVLDTVDLFHESFFLYAEETELCYRINKAGFTLLINANVEIKHFRNEPLRFHSVYYIWRNSFILSKKCFKNVYRFMYLLRRFIVLPKYLIKYILLGRLDLIKAMLIGIFDGMMGREGISIRNVVK